MIHCLAKWKLSQIESLNYLHINFILNTAAVTTKEYLRDLSRKYTKKAQKGKMPRWITNIQGKVIRLRQTIRHLTTIINCKKTGIFINHQNNDWKVLTAAV